MKPEHDGVVTRPAGLDGQHGNAAELTGSGGHVVSERSRAQQLLEVRALLDRVTADVERGIADDLLQRVLLLLAHRRLLRLSAVIMRPRGLCVNTIIGIGAMR
ncbi:MAG: hypothetical protein FWD04_11255 [Conexibacteraceae bacterium]|nr:hypothetical protein [Conexibacteraceae bacterium]